MSTIDQREEARYRQDVLVSYRAWLSYLEAQQTLLAAAGEGQAGLDPFEGMSSAQERAANAQRTLAALPADRRELFDAIYEGDRQRIQRQLDAEAPLRGGTVKRADPDEVARRALTHLLEEAQGLHREDRRGLVPRGKPDAVKWLAIDLTEIAQAPPSETDYQLSAGRMRKRRGLITNLVFAAAALVAIPIVIFSLRQSGQPTASAGVPTGNGSTLTPWPVVAVGAPNGDAMLPVEAVETRWPAACADAAEGACWQHNSFRPLRLCLPAARLAGLTALRVAASAGWPDRVFALTTGADADADLLVSPCGVEPGAAVPLVGRLRAVEAAPALVPGAAAPGGFQVAAITARGRGEDPTIAEGYLMLTVVIRDDDPNREWGALAPTVLLADGSTVSPSGSAQDGLERRLDYSIADQIEPFDVLWQVTLADQVVRYRATLEAPPARDAVLRTRLRVEDLAVTPSQQTMAVTLTLHNTAASPLVVEGADLGFQTNATHREIAAPALRQPLAPGERRVITLDLPLESGVLQIGPFRYEFTARR